MKQLSLKSTHYSRNEEITDYSENYLMHTIQEYTLQRKALNIRASSSKATGDAKDKGRSQQREHWRNPDKGPSTELGNNAS